eukprot:scaffold27552_cov24-Tisochrysis_lutea.AAC.1
MSLKLVHGQQVLGAMQEKVLRLVHLQQELGALQENRRNDQGALQEEDASLCAPVHMKIRMQEIVYENVVDIADQVEHMCVCACVARMEARLSSQSVHARSTSEIDEELEGLEVERESKEREREVSMRKQNKLKEE